TQDLVVGAIQHRLESRYSAGRPYRRLNVGWFGGEPLLALGAIRRLTPQLRDASGRFGAVYTAHVVTNGVGLTPLVARELAEDLDVDLVEVTLDGPPAVHDARRHTKSGHATFERIWTNLNAIASDPVTDFALSLRCNVDRSNADAVPELISLIATSPL